VVYSGGSELSMVDGERAIKVGKHFYCHSP
jgi:hypothetical protein